MNKRYLIKVAGIVQGVGFRPYIFRLADRLQLSGFVNNNSEGVVIEVEGPDNKINHFLKTLKDQPPPLAQLTHLDITEVNLKNDESFQIQKSKSTDQKSTLISPDISTCEDCRTELLDTSDRRYLYPFINCTNCGPRYTIISDIPYDRPKTSMSKFKLCDICQEEYDNPLDRRFHAQPNACPVCGPSLEFIDSQQNVSTDKPIEKLNNSLLSGKIAAIKGLGGFHLAVDPMNDRAVKRLRERKHRFEKPLALMVKDIETANKYVYTDETTVNLLSSLHRPIVLCKKKPDCDLSTDISIDNDYFGIMFPYSPLHELIFQCGDFDVLVMTSANLSEEPICYENQECLEQMGSIADCFLIHNREIYIRCDDSVMQVWNGNPHFIRRSRGYSPRPIILSKAGSSVLAVGGQLKNTICMTKDNYAFISQHIGDLENLKTLKAFEHTVEHLQKIFEIKSKVYIRDLHPDYLSSKWVEDQKNLSSRSVQHHYAHILSVMAEHHIEHDLIGIALDGTGYGEDGAVWGGEVITCNLNSFKRKAHFEYLPMPGGEKAILEPWRMGVSYLIKYLNDGEDLAQTFFSDRQFNLNIITKAIEKKINAPETSSCGRLFDAVAAILGIKNVVAYEGQAAIKLESLALKADSSIPDIDSFELIKNDDKYLMTPNKILRKIADLKKSNDDIAGISRAFHLALVDVFTRVAEIIRSDTGLNKIALSGGCFQNMLLLKELSDSLKRKNFHVFTNREVPVNDGGISLGQAYWGMHNS
jgi:hydrogenase maturation protein HypF